MRVIERTGQVEDTHLFGDSDGVAVLSLQKGLVSERAFFALRAALTGLIVFNGGADNPHHADELRVVESVEECVSLTTDSAGDGQVDPYPDA